MPTEGKTKPFKTYDEQIALLKSRGLIISNEEEAKEILKRMNYYRLSAYSLTLRKDDVFYPNVSIEDIVALYDFDADLRKIVFYYSSKAETAARAYIAFLCQVGTKKILRIYKPFIGGQPPVNGLLHLIKPLIDLSEPDSDPPAVLAFLSDAQDNLYRQAVPW